MAQAIRKKLIEVSIPLEAINEEARRRKQKAPKGYPTSFHKYWAQRPVAACRAILFAQLVDDPSAWPEHFPTEEAQEVERRRLHKLIKELIPWEASRDLSILDRARWEIARSISWSLKEVPPRKGDSDAILAYLQAKGPTIYDPFSGAGSIPLEAQRLGLKTYGSDLNPVAVLIGKGLVEIPPRFANLRPVNPNAQEAISGSGAWNGRFADGLAADIQYYAMETSSRSWSEISNIYPQIKSNDGDYLDIVAWMWARTVRSPDPIARGAMVPLVSSFLLSGNGNHASWVDLVLDEQDRDGWQFVVHSGVLPEGEGERIRRGTKGRSRSSDFNCVLTGANIQGDYIKAEGMAGRLGKRLMAIVADSKKGRVYITPTQEQEDILELIRDNQVVLSAKEEFLSQEVPARLTGGTCYPYGLTTFGSLFTERQILGLSTFSRISLSLLDEIEQDAVRAGMSTDGVGLSSGGSGARAYAEAIVTYIALAIGRMALYGSSLCRWLTKDNALGSAIAQKGLEMTWDFAEANFFGKSSASMLQCSKNVAECLLHQTYNSNTYSEIVLKDARSRFELTNVVWDTDPPYYDNIAYADLSDYFYSWHKQSLKDIYPELYRRFSTNKNDELIAVTYRERQPVSINTTYWHTLSRDERAELFFMTEITKVFENASRSNDDRTPMAVYYAFRQRNQNEEGITSAGWASILQAISDSQFVIDGTWPLRTELTAALKTNTNSLASSIVLVCRKRNRNAPISTRADFVRELRRELPASIEIIRRAGVGPVDMQQAVIGPGMGVFTRYTKVLESDDSPMNVKTALTLINRVWEEIENELDANFDPETQVALAWYASYGYDTKKSGELNVVANAKNVAQNALFDALVFKNLHGSTALTSRGELPLDWRPATEKHLTVWRCLQQVARVLKAEQGGGDAAAKLVAEMGSHAADAQKLAYRLFEIATRKGLNDEALVYNELAQEWAKLEDLAAASQAAARPSEAQPSFQF